MKYKIVDIGPGQIKVEFENGSLARIGIGPDFTPEEIDNVVYDYDPDSQPDPETLINRNVSVGEERVSVKREYNESNFYEDPDLEKFKKLEEFIPAIREPVLSFGRAHSVDVIVLSEYFAQRGDTRLKEALLYQTEKFINSEHFDLEETILELRYDPDEVFELAMKELEDENV
jgi:hypothetical protein